MIILSPIPRVLLQSGVYSLPELLDSVDVLEPLHVGVKEYDGPQTPELGLIHRHLLHFGHKLDQDSVKDSADSTCIRILPCHNDSISQLNS